MNSVKLLKIVSLVLVLVTAASLWSGCSTGSGSNQAQQNQVVTVQRGDLAITITASGNLALSQTADLAFEMAGYVQQVSVEAGDSVKEGQVLAALDTSSWEDQITTLERSVTTAQRSLTTAQRSVTANERKVNTANEQVATAERQVGVKERALTTAQALVNTKVLAVGQANVNLQSAQYDLSQISAVKAIQDDIDNANFLLKVARMLQSGDFEGVYDYFYWQDQIDRANTWLTQANQDMKSLLSGTSITAGNSEDVLVQVAQAEQQVQEDQQAVDDAGRAVDDAKAAVVDAEAAVADAQTAVVNAQNAVSDAEAALGDANTAVGDAQQKLQDAQKTLDDEKSLSPLIKAPFDGFVTAVNVKGGDEVFKGAVAVTVADPAKFETNVLVNELDILKIQEGAQATVQVNAMQGINLPARVTYISPTASISSGVVNYSVKVEILSTQPIPAQAGGQRPPTASANTTGQTPRSPAASANTTEQASRSPASGNRQPSAAAQAVQLKQGLSVTVSIMVQQRNNVLLIPNRAISRQGNQTIVQVSKDGVIKPVSIKTGLSNNQYTEVTDGLSEGDQLTIIPVTAPASTSNQRPGGFGGILR